MANTKLLSVSQPDVQHLKQSLDSAQLAAEYEQSSKELQVVIKDEELRKLRVRVLLLEDEVDHLNGQLAKGEEHVEELRRELYDTGEQLAELDVNAQQVANDLRARTRELELLKAELSSMAHLSNDTAKILTDKLSLAREVASLKPEVESLRAQVATHREVLAEKLALQRQLPTVQLELENAQRTLDRHAARQAKNHDRSEFEVQLDEAHAELKEANKARKMAEREVQRLTAELEHPSTSQKQKSIPDEESDRASDLAVKRNDKLGVLKKEIAELRKQLKSEVSTRTKLEAQLHKSAEQVAETSTLDNATALIAERDSLQRDVTTHKKEISALQKAGEKNQLAWDAEKSLLEDKLEAFRNKLRSTKEKLKLTEQQLKELHNTTASEKNAARPAVKNPRKRAAVQIDQTMLGTPGDGPQQKRSKMTAANLARAAVANTSSFSITPFLNRTMSVVPEPLEEAMSVTKSNNSEPTTASPTSDALQSKATKSRALKPVSSSKHNVRKMAGPIVMEKVTEEPSMLERVPTPPPEPEEDAPVIVATKVTKVPLASGEPTLKLKAKNPGTKSRKSLMSFASFVEEAAPEKKKKRKLGGGGPKTLFDEDDDEKLPSKPIPGRGIFGVKSLSNPFVFGKQKSLAAPAADALQQFSPLKKHRRK